MCLKVLEQQPEKKSGGSPIKNPALAPKANAFGTPAPDMETVKSVLTELRTDRDNLKSYDRSVMWNAWALIGVVAKFRKRSLQA